MDHVGEFIGILKRMDDRIEKLEKEIKGLKSGKTANEFFEEINQQIRDHRDINKAAGK